LDQGYLWFGFKLQKKAACVITSASYNVHGPNKYFRVDWMPIHKNLLIEENVRSNFLALSFEKPNTIFLKKRFSHRAVKSWNDLSNNITQNVDNITH
jgi:hypothetical protein